MRNALFDDKNDTENSPNMKTNKKFIIVPLNYECLLTLVLDHSN